MFISDIKKKVKEKKSRGEAESSEALTENRQAFDHSKTGTRYLIAAVIIAAAAQVYELFSHGVYSGFMTFAFLIPLLGGALPYFAAEFAARRDSERVMDNAGKSFAEAGEPERNKWIGIKDAQLAAVATLTAGSLLKGALDIYGTTNRLLIAYPMLTAAIITAGLISHLRKSRRCNAAQGMQQRP